MVSEHHHHSHHHHRPQQHHTPRPSSALPLTSSQSLAVRGAGSSGGGGGAVAAGSGGAGGGGWEGGGGAGAGPVLPSSSAVSRPVATSRSRRYHRSHAGAPALYTGQNEFPIFGHSGDVEILVRLGAGTGAAGHENRYLLHRHTLTRCSGFFEASLSQEWARALPPDSGGGAAAASAPPVNAITAGVAPAAAPSASTELARIAEDGRSETSGPGPSYQTPARPRWRYELDLGSGEDDIPMLVQKPPPPPLSPLSPISPLSRIEGPGGNGATASSIFGGPAARSKTTPGQHRHHHSSSSGFFRSMANLSIVSSPAAPGSGPPPPPPLSQPDQDLLRDYDNLFRIFYNYSPILDGVSIADAYVQCKSLLCLADQYDALVVVGPRVDHHLLQFQSRLWRQIAKYPISYLRLGYLARSKVIFQEALIHVVGQWPVGERSLRAALPDAVLDIIEDKVDELEELVGRVEGRLFRLGLVTSRGERVTPATSYLDWLAVSLFRQWLADNTAAVQQPAEPSSAAALAPPDRRRAVGGAGAGPGPGPGGQGAGTGGREVATLRPSAPSVAAAAATPHLGVIGRAFRTLGSANAAIYLGHDDCKRFLKLTPELYTRENLRRFEKRLDEIKGMARDIVGPLMGSGLELEIGSSSAAGGRVGDGLGYLTCTTVGDRDLPWPIEE